MTTQKKVVRLLPHEVDEALKNDPNFFDTHRVFIKMPSEFSLPDGQIDMTTLTDNEFLSYVNSIPEPKTDT